MEGNSGKMAGLRPGRQGRGSRVVLVLALAIGASLPGASTASSGQATTSTLASTSSVCDAKAAPKPSTETYQLPPERYQKAVSLARKEYTLYFVAVAWGILVLLALLQTGVVARLRDIAESASPKRSIQGLIFVPALMLVLAVLHLPISIYAHRLSLQYQQSIQGWGSWFWDWTKGEVLSLGLGYIVALLLVSVIRWKPRTWWLYFWYAMVPLSLFLFFISPWFLDPMFNRFTPLQDKHPELVEAIGKLTQRAGVPIPPERMFLMEASAKTNAINAYVTGVGASKRVVVWDTTIQKTNPDEVLAVVGHELGHYVLGHTWKGFLFFTGGMLIGLYVAYRALQWVLARWGKAWGVRGQEDWAALAVLLLIYHLLEFVGTPIGNGFSRMQEHAADVYGLEVTHGVLPNSQQVAAQSFQKMGDIDLADPNPSKFITFWLYSHPPLRERLEFAHNYDPWSKGESPKYVK
jgi:Zn-dependent protease with chaperone function